ncbi:MAG: acylphosphatase [Ruminococcus sp.]|nr:acylphosphatase [Ruminococcus sp.]
MEIIRRNYTFYGSVQGVGFRYRAYYAAREFSITGWVKNEYDGSVVMEVQGTRENIESMLKRIQSGRFVSIDNCLCRSLPTQTESTFEIIG